MEPKDLAKLAKEIGIDVTEYADMTWVADPKSWIKEQWVEAILKHDLVGKVPSDIAKECKLLDLDELCPKIKKGTSKAKGK